MAKEKGVKKDENGRKAAGLFIPAGLFLGFGFGFLVNDVPAGMFGGMGLGFLAFALVAVFKK